MERALCCLREVATFGVLQLVSFSLTTPLRLINSELIKLNATIKQAY